MKNFLSLLFLFSLVSGYSQKSTEYRLIMRNTGTDTMWDGKSMKIYGFALKLSENPPVPGHTLYVNEGDTLKINAWNISQGDPHTIHPHGMDADQMNDGTPMTSFTIKHMKSYVYTIPCPHAGTYIYHCHMADVVHVQMGMYGLVVVRPKDGSQNNAWTGGPAYAKEYAFLTSEFDKKWHDSVPMNPNHTDTMSADSMIHEMFNIPPYKPDYFLVNGKSKTQITKDSSLHISGKANENIYIRLANIGYYLNEVVFPAAMDATWIDSDGRPLPKSVKSDTIRIAPGERYGIMLKASKEFTDSVAFRYINLNTNVIEDAEYLPLAIKGIAGINEGTNPLQKINIYPNPAHTEINLAFLEKIPGSIRISLINALGQTIKEELLINPSLNSKIDVSNISRGIYSINLQSGRNSFSQKILIQ